MGKRAFAKGWRALPRLPGDGPEPVAPGGMVARALRPAVLEAPAPVPPPGTRVSGRTTSPGGPGGADIMAGQGTAGGGSVAGVPGCRVLGVGLGAVYPPPHPSWTQVPGWARGALSTA